MAFKLHDRAQEMVFEPRFACAYRHFKQLSEQLECDLHLGGNPTDGYWFVLQFQASQSDKNIVGAWENLRYWVRILSPERAAAMLLPTDVIEACVLCSEYLTTS